MKNAFSIGLCLLTTSLFAQEINPKLNDTVRTLLPVIVTGKIQSPERMPEVKDNVLFSGKKNEILKLSNINGNFATNNTREVFSRVPGVNIWENEGSGIQINVGVRGLSPNRSWELNTRQNGYDISSDVFGYPEAYYNPPLEAVETIELIRGGASLQFGPQFGGMLNYVLKRETKKKFTFETQNSVGSYGLMSSYNAIGGTLKNFSYYVYNHSRSADGWRQNGEYTIRNTHAFLEYRFTPNTKISAEYTNMDYQMKQSGGLTDAQFEANPQQSLRNRNWLGTPWNVLSIQLDTKINENLTSNTKLFGLIGERNSVGFTTTPNVPDAINPTTDNYANRRVDRDFYENFGVENRNVYKYKLGKTSHNLAFGARAYQATTIRKQSGNGTTGSDFDLSVNPDYTRNIKFKTENIAFFAENQFRVTEKFSATPGVRFEHITSSGAGLFAVNNGSNVNFDAAPIVRNKALFGLGLEYKFTSTNVYANISQAYRPILFSDLTPPAVTDVIDPNLKDASGYNADLGYRGNINNYINFDIGLFYLQYNNRIGGVRQFTNNDPSQGTFLYRTNLGTTVNKGIESFFNINITRFLEVDKQIGNVDFFASMSFIDSRYIDFETFTTTGTPPNTVITSSNLDGKRVENAPRYIHNFGLSWGKNNISTTLQYRLTGKIFTDANNTTTPSANGVTGLLDKYNVFDFSSEYKFLEKYNIRTGINNVFDEAYTTRRSSGYPGPGILPGDGRTLYISVGAKF